MRLTTGWYRSIVATGFGVLLYGSLLANSQKRGSSCPTPAPLNPVVNACFNSMAESGCIDSYFGSAGEVTFSGTGLGLQGAIRLQPPPASPAGGVPKIIVINQTGSSATVMRLNLDGTLDSTFGTNGASSYQLSGIAVYDGLIDANRNILVGGYAGSDLFVIRFLPDGGVDTSFGSNGVFSYQPSGSGWSATAWALALQPDGKIVVAGSQSGPKPPSYALVLRLTSNGALDSSFGSGGISSFIPAGSKDGGLKAVALQSLGSATYIIGAGIVNGGGWLGRLTSSGAIDSSFGSNGQVVGSTCGGVANARSVYVDGSGSIFMLGDSNGLNLAKYTASGAVDTTFGDVSGSGHTGNTSLKVFGGGNWPGYSSSLIATTDSTGTTKLVVTGYASTPGYPSYTYAVVARYNVDGTLDSTFGGGGVVARQFGSGAAWGIGSVAEPNGEIVPLIFWDNSGGYLALTRYWP